MFYIQYENNANERTSGIEQDSTRSRPPFRTLFPKQQQLQLLIKHKMAQNWQQNMVLTFAKDQKTKKYKRKKYIHKKIKESIIYMYVEILPTDLEEYIKF